LNKEIIEEGYRFIQGNVIILLHRYLDIPSGLQVTANGPQANFGTVLPSYDSLVPFDSENKWIVTARVDVLNANDQEYVQKGIDELLSVKEAFEGLFDFKVLERRMLDTRVRH
jgi:mediator of RNA polymerase II transcription subunit 18